jgi:hypothetical protein
MNTSVNTEGQSQSVNRSYTLFIFTVLALLLQLTQAQWTYTIDTSMNVNIMRDFVFVADMQKRYDQTAEWVDRNAPPQTTFSPTPRLSVESFAASLGETPEDVQTLTATLTQGFDAFEQEAQRLEKTHNVAMTFAYLVGVCYLVYYNEEPSETVLLNLQANPGWLGQVSTTL